jgi:hypothetical protein
MKLEIFFRISEAIYEFLLLFCSIITCFLSIRLEKNKKIKFDIADKKKSYTFAIRNSG